MFSNSLAQISIVEIENFIILPKKQVLQSESAGGALGWEYEYMKFWSQIYSIYLYILLIYESQISIFDRNFYRGHKKKSACEFRVQAEACAGRMS